VERGASGYIKANSYMKGLTPISIACGAATVVDGGGIGVAYHTLQTVSHKCSALFLRSQGHCHWWFSSMVTVTGSFFIDSHSSKVQRVLDDCPKLVQQ